MALVSALEAGQIAAAGLDVTAIEPLPRDHPLLALDNCLVLPPIGSATLAGRSQMAELAVGAVIANCRASVLNNGLNLADATGGSKCEH